MLKLRTILLYNYLYYLLLFVCLVYSIVYLNIERESIYNENSNELEGTIINYHITSSKLILTIKANEKVLVTYYFKNKKEETFFTEKISLGDKVKVTGEFITPPKNTTENLFNYKKYLENKKIYFIVKANIIEKISNNKNTFLYLKNKLIKKLKNKGYMQAFILGQKSSLSQTAISSYQENGISHLFAISGMHISLLTSIIAKILNKFKLSEQNNFLITVVCLLFYSMLTNLSASIIRGVLFYILFSINRIFYFYIKPTNIFILVLVITLLINPFFLYDVGFYYSFSISFFLILLAPILSSNKNYFYSLLKTSIASFLVSLPISLHSFYQINILSIFYNLIYVPLVSIVIFPLSMFTLIIPPLEFIFNITTTILEKSSIYLSKISILKLTFPHAPFLLYILYFSIITIAILKNKTKLFLLLTLILFIHYFSPSFVSENYLKTIEKTTTNMIQKISSMFAVNPLFSKGI